MILQSTNCQLRRWTARLIPAIGTVILCAALAAPCRAGGPIIRANDLLRQAVANERIGGRQDYYSWTDRLQKPRGSVTKLMVETPQGILASTLKFNDRSLTPDERRQDDERNRRLLDPEKMREKARKQNDDQRHIERILLALPDAFQCEYGAEQDVHNLRLECSPNPQFSAPNYESQVLEGMKTVILIDRAEKRITRIEGTLFRDVNFGWGFIGRLNHDGGIAITQSKVAGNHWGITEMRLKFEGRIVVFKPLKIEETETCWGYQPAPKMNVAEALEFLRDNSAKASQ
jgi:hypothetical protein